ncbi:hypothetical protein, partial [uncultured Pseudoflavonifractor sp.]|uniref:hypothetical protein n=1 Tax=uncultured Pseudoflavonifractor sp. TaxID=1221379 RepID=UPI0025DB21F6
GRAFRAIFGASTSSSVTLEFSSSLRTIFAILFSTFQRVSMPNFLLYRPIYRKNSMFVFDCQYALPL